MQTVRTSLQTGNHTNTSSLNFYRPDAVINAQTTAKNKIKQMILTVDIY